MSMLRWERLTQIPTIMCVKAPQCSAIGERGGLERLLKVTGVRLVKNGGLFGDLRSLFGGYG